MEKGLKLLKIRSAYIEGVDAKKTKRANLVDTISQLNQCELDHCVDECGCNDCCDHTDCVKLYDEQFA